MKTKKQIRNQSGGVVPITDPETAFNNIIKDPQTEITFIKPDASGSIIKIQIGNQEINPYYVLRRSTFASPITTIFAKIIYISETKSIIKTEFSTQKFNQKINTLTINQFNNEFLTHDKIFNDTFCDCEPLAPTILYLNNDYDITTLTPNVQTLQYGIIVMGDACFSPKTKMLDTMGLFDEQSKLQQNLNDDQLNQLSQAIYAYIELANYGWIHGDHHAGNIMYDLDYDYFLNIKGRCLFINYARAYKLDYTENKTLLRNIRNFLYRTTIYNNIQDLLNDIITPLFEKGFNMAPTKSLDTTFKITDNNNYNWVHAWSTMPYYVDTIFSILNTLVINRLAALKFSYTRIKTLVNHDNLLVNLDKTIVSQRPNLMQWPAKFNFIKNIKCQTDAIKASNNNLSDKNPTFYEHLLKKFNLSLDELFVGGNNPKQNSRVLRYKALNRRNTTGGGNQYDSSLITPHEFIILIMMRIFLLSKKSNNNNSTIQRSKTLSLTRTRSHNTHTNTHTNKKRNNLSQLETIPITDIYYAMYWFCNMVNMVRELNNVSNV